MIALALGQLLFGFVLAVLFMAGLALVLFALADRFGGKR